MLFGHIQPFRIEKTHGSSPNPQVRRICRVVYRFCQATRTRPAGSGLSGKSLQENPDCQITSHKLFFQRSNFLQIQSKKITFKNTQN
jgi:hypothetical protein